MIFIGLIIYIYIYKNLKIGPAKLHGVLRSQSFEAKSLFWHSAVASFLASHLDVLPGVFISIPGVAEEMGTQIEEKDFKE